MTEDLKKTAAEKALELVQDGMLLGLGSGTTSRYFTEGVGRLVARGMKLRCVPTPIIQSVGPKKISPDALAFVQEMQIDRRAKTASFKNIAEHPRVRAHLEKAAVPSHGAVLADDALFAVDTKTAQQIGDAAALFLQSPIGQFRDGVGEREFFSPTFIDIAIKQPGHRVVGTHASSPQFSEL